MPNSEVFCSTIIPTIRRDTLARAVESVLNQACDLPFEVIVVNDSGQPVPPAAWQQDPRVEMLDTQKRERSVARNTGAAIARGRYLHFLDDDDWLLPGALDTFARLAQGSSAAWLYGASQLTDASGQCLFQFDHQLSGNCFTQVMAGEWVPLQASLIATSAFFGVGGFDAIRHSVQDKDLLLRVALRYELAGTPTPVTGILRGVWNSSTNWPNVTREWRNVCEQVLNMPGAPARLRASASNAYWQGRLLRAYVLSAGWNVRQANPIIMTSRLYHAAGTLLLAGGRLFSADFWRAMTRPHLTQGFEPARLVAGQPIVPVGSRPGG